MLKNSLEKASDDIQELISYSEALKDPYITTVRALGLRQDDFQDTIALIDQEAWTTPDNEYMKWLGTRCKIQIKRNNEIMQSLLKSWPFGSTSPFNCILQRFTDRLISLVKEIGSDIGKPN